MEADVMIEAKEIGRRLRDHRLKAGMSQEQVKSYEWPKVVYKSKRTPELISTASGGLLSISAPSGTARVPAHAAGRAGQHTRTPGIK